MSMIGRAKKTSDLLLKFHRTAFRHTSRPISSSILRDLRPPVVVAENTAQDVTGSTIHGNAQSNLSNLNDVSATSINPEVNDDSMENIIMLQHVQPQEEEVDVEEDVGIELPEYDFGSYSLILPPNPPIYGIKHFQPARPVPPNIGHPPYAQLLLPPAHRHVKNVQHWDPYGPKTGKIIDLDTADVDNVMRAGQLARETLIMAESLVKVGTTTDEIDAAVHEFIISKGAYPSPLHYNGFPRSCCTSVNNVVAHGIPDDRALENGDIVNIDITVYLNGFHGDTSKTFAVGKIDEEAEDLLYVTDEAMTAALAACGPGQHYRAIGNAIHCVLSEQRFSSFSVSPQFTGHGIGRTFHRPPWILHTVNNEPEVMMPGDCFTIEPCIVQGRDPRSWVFPDGWTASTLTGARSAQVEHMILITKTEALRLT